MDSRAMAQWDIAGPGGFDDLADGEADCGTLMKDLEGRLQSMGGDGPRLGRRFRGREEEEEPVTEFVWQSHNRCHCLPARELRLPFADLAAPLRLLEVLDGEETAVRFAVMGEEDSF